MVGVAGAQPFDRLCLAAFVAAVAAAVVAVAVRLLSSIVKINNLITFEIVKTIAISLRSIYKTEKEQ